MSKQKDPHTSLIHSISRLRTLCDKACGKEDENEEKECDEYETLTVKQEDMKVLVGNAAEKIKSAISKLKE